MRTACFGSRAQSRPLLAVLGLALVLAGSALAPSPPRAQAPADSPGARGVEGNWQGTIQGMIRIVFHFQRDSLDALTGTMDSPDQGAFGLAIDTISFAGDSLRFEMQRIRGAYAGRLEATGDSISGYWTQGGFTLPLHLARQAKPIELRRPQEPKKPYPYAEDTVRIENRAAGVSLAGTLTKPSAGGPFPAVLLITGSGPEDRDETVFGHRPFLVLADHLTRQGIAVLRVDDRGVGGSSGSQRTATSEDFASDVLAGVAFLKARRDIDPKRIGLIGHSEGGLIAPMAAVRARDVAFIVLLAGPGLRGDSLLLLQNAALLRASGVGDEAIARQLTAMRRVLARVVEGADSAAVFRAAREMVEAQLASVPAEQRRAFGSSDSLAIGATRQYLFPWMRFFIGFDPRPTLERVKCPVLALNGAKDLQVTPAENLAAIEQALKRGRNPDFTVRELPGLNHLFQAAATGAVSEYAQIEETIAPAALEEMSAWILARTSPRR